MSEAQPGGESSTALGCRENFFDHDADDYEEPTDQQPAGGDAADYIDPSPEPGAAVLREQWAIDYYLRKHPEAELFCPYCWHELGAESELTDPEDYVPESEVVADPLHPRPGGRPPDGADEAENIELEDLDYETRLECWTEPKYGDHRRHRSCTNCGGVSWGGVLGDLTTDQFLAAVDEYLETKSTCRRPPRRGRAEAEAETARPRGPRQPQRDRLPRRARARC